MILIEKTQVVGLEPAIRGMRNPMNSWAKSDSGTCHTTKRCCACEDSRNGRCSDGFVLGDADYDLMKRLSYGGSVHAKYRRMIVVYVDITAPLYWWKEFDTYKVGTVANSCSTMHKIHAREFTIDDFSHEHLTPAAVATLNSVIERLNFARKEFLKGRDASEFGMPSAKDYWWDMIQLLPSSYNQKRTIMLNYEVLAGLYPMRKDHKLDEWHEFCHWIESLPYSSIISQECMESVKES